MALDCFYKMFSVLKSMINEKTILATGQVGDGRERALAEHVLNTAEKGNPESVLKAIDAFAKGTWFMNVGDDKGSILDSALRKYNPRVALEIGTYCGYSAVRIASQLRRDGSKLIALEMSPLNCHIAQQIIDHAGVSAKVHLVQGKFHERIDEVKQFLKDMEAPYFDFVFLDHWKNRYLADYLVLKENGMVGSGSGICADNMGFLIGPPDFKKYVRTHPRELLTVEYQSNVEYFRWIPDAITVSTYINNEELPEVQYS